MTDLSLARYQSALMALLARKDIDDNERLRLLREEPAFAPFADYVAGVQRPFLSSVACTMGYYARPSGEEPER
jgi:hypothetical protein